MNADEIKRLREIAGKAQEENPGPWEHWRGDEVTDACVCRWMEPGNMCYEIFDGGAESSRDFIAAFNPSTALSLLDRLDALLAKLEGKPQ